MIAHAETAITPEPPGRIGVAIPAEDALRYLEALGTWRDQRKRELDLLDEAALASPDGASGGSGSRGSAAGPLGSTGSTGSTGSGLTGDVMLSMALWKAVADRYDLLIATWDSGRVGQAERERLSSLIWGRLDATLDPRLAQRPDVPSSSGALAVSLPEAMRLSDALAASLRARLSLDPSDADVSSRVRQLRAQLERVRDLVSAVPEVTTVPQVTGAPQGNREALSRKLSKLDGRLAEMVDKARRGADVGGLVAPLEADAARIERDLIVGSATRTEAARDVARAHQLRDELAARGAAIRDLAAQCVAAVDPAPRLAVPDVAALGPVPQTAAEVDVYLARLATVSRALNFAHAAYATALDERSELRGRLEAYAIKATQTVQISHTSQTGTARGSAGASTDHHPAGSATDDLGELFRRAQDALSAQPADMVRARALVAAHQAYLAARSTPPPHGLTRGTR